jgi:hypothetical protein
VGIWQVSLGSAKPSREGARTAGIAGPTVIDPEAGRSEQIRNGPIEMATASERLPHRHEPILEADHPAVWRPAMLHEQGVAAEPEHPSHLGEGGVRIGDRSGSGLGYPGTRTGGASDLLGTAIARKGLLTAGPATSPVLQATSAPAARPSAP